jgi:SAM-dependent methyltransferase
MVILECCQQFRMINKAMSKKQNSKQHWEKIYQSKADTEVSWFQPLPEYSLKLIEKFSYGNSQLSIADVGGGNSMLANELVKKGYVLDISKASLERNKKRIPDAKINWVESDILEHDFREDIYIWHDRAVFHFLTHDKDVQKYYEIASTTISPGGYLILGTFSESGPVKCSGLPIRQYSKEKFEAVFGEKFTIEDCFSEEHITPFNTQQNFIWCILKRSCGSW